MDCGGSSFGFGGGGFEPYATCKYITKTVRAGRRSSSALSVRVCTHVCAWVGARPRHAAACCPTLHTAWAAGLTCMLRLPSVLTPTHKQGKDCPDSTSHALAVCNMFGCK